MPVLRGHDSKGSFYRYGKHGKKYYYKTNEPVSRVRAKAKAKKQGKAAHSSKMNGGMYGFTDGKRNKDPIEDKPVFRPLRKVGGSFFNEIINKKSPILQIMKSKS